MGALEAAMVEIEQARATVDETDVRTKLESIATSLEEMIDTEAGELTDAEAAFGDTDFPGSAASGDNLEELEIHLADLAAKTGGESGVHMEAARRQIASFRTDQKSENREQA